MGLHTSYNGRYKGQLAEFPASRVSEILRIVSAPEDVLNRFLNGTAGYWETVKLARVKDSPVAIPAATPSTAAPAENNATEEPEDDTHERGTFTPTEEHPIFSHELFHHSEEQYVTATGIPMASVQLTVPLGDAHSFDKVLLLKPARLVVSLAGFGNLCITLQRL